MWKSNVNLRLLAGLLGLAVIVALGLVYHEWATSPVVNYHQFINRDQPYYAGIADACDRLIASVPRGAQRIKHIPGNDDSLPAPFRQLHCRFIDVEADRVFIMVGAGRVGFGIIWEHDDEDRAL